MMRCLAVDDEPLALKIIAGFCAQVPYLELVSTSASAIEVLEFIQRESIDLIFLDINMPHLTGVDFVKMNDRLPMVIFTTAYPNYALTGFDLNAVDYLLKPFSFDRFFKAVTKAHELYLLKQGPDSTVPVSVPESEYLMVRVEYSTMKVKIEEILFVEGLKDYIKIYTAQKNYITKSTLKNIEEKLNEQKFVRVHKSFIVQLDKVESFENNRIVIGPHRIPVGNQNRDSFLEFLSRNRL